MFYVAGRFLHNLLMLKGFKAIQSGSVVTAQQLPHTDWLEPLSTADVYVFWWWS